MSDAERLSVLPLVLPKRLGAPLRPFHAEVDEDDDSHGAREVRIFHGATQIGAYERNYPAYGPETFEPFERDGKWYALYSNDYTCTRIMSLPDCRDIGGEEPASEGFCPVDLYVPRYRSWRYSFADGTANEHWHFGSKAEGLVEDPRTKVGPWTTLDIAFVAGCIWGDDSSWKLEVFDISQAAEGILSRDARFGYVEIAAGMPLAAAVQLHRHLPNPLRARILREETRDIATGKRVHHYSDELMDGSDKS